MRNSNKIGLLKRKADKLVNCRARADVAHKCVMSTHGISYHVEIKGKSPEVLANGRTGPDHTTHVNIQQEQHLVDVGYKNDRIRFTFAMGDLRNMVSFFLD